MCTAYNADFDGDQMAVHVPLCIEAQMESRVLMMSTNNILSPAHGKPIIVPTQDIVLGLYYMTRERAFAWGSYNDPNVDGYVVGRYASPQEVRMSYDHGGLHLQATIMCRMRVGEPMVETTCGRVLLYEGGIPQELPFDLVNRALGKKELNEMIDVCYRKCGQKKTVLMADYLRSTGYTEATKAGISICVDDMYIPEDKAPLLDGAFDEVKRISGQYADGLITSGERYNKVIDIWANVSEQIANAMMDRISTDEVENPKTGNTEKKPSFNSIFIMADSGARGSRQQMRQLAGMRGLMAKPSGEIIEFPITTNFREGLTVLQYFISTHGARKGLADTALKTANSGYLTRRLVDVAQEAVVTEYDCGTIGGIEVEALVEAGEVIERLGDRVLGRTALEPIYMPGSDEVICDEGEVFDEARVRRLEEAGVQSIRIRSVLTCEALRGICARCYGRDLARGNLVDVGEAVGIIAAQSIGEPGTQLTMRTFHIGGVGNVQAEQSTLEARFGGKVTFEDFKAVPKGDEQIVMNRYSRIILLDERDRPREQYSLNYGARLKVKEGEQVAAGQLMAEWEPHSIPILADVGGTVEFADIMEGVTMQVRVDEFTNHSSMVIQESRDPDARPRVVIRTEAGEIATYEGKHEARYFLPVNAQLSLTEGQKIEAGDVLARIARESTKTKDITGGLPRVVELFEARTPKEHAIIAEVDGLVSFGKDKGGKRADHRVPGRRRSARVPRAQGPPRADP